MFLHRADLDSAPRRTRLDSTTSIITHKLTYLLTYLLVEDLRVHLALCQTTAEVL